MFVNWLFSNKTMSSKLPWLVIRWNSQIHDAASQCCSLLAVVNWSGSVLRRWDNLIRWPVKMTQTDCDVEEWETRLQAAMEPNVYSHVHMHIKGTVHPEIRKRIFCSCCAIHPSRLSRYELQIFGDICLRSYKTKANSNVAPQKLWL